MLRLLEFFCGKNSSPIFSELVRARASNPFILLVGTIKPCNFYYQHFLLRPLLSEIFAGPFHRAKTTSQGRTVVVKAVIESSLNGLVAPSKALLPKRKFDLFYFILVQQSTPRQVKRAFLVKQSPTGQGQYYVQPKVL